MGGGKPARLWYEGAALASKRWLHADERGSVIGWSGSSGSMIATRSYDEWGVMSDAAAVTGGAGGRFAQAPNPHAASPLAVGARAFYTPPAREGRVNDEALQRQLELLRQEHRDLDAAIAALGAGATPDQLQIARLKKRKLALRDRISLIEDQLFPDIIA